MGAGQNKVFLPIRGQALICHTVQAFTRIPDIDDLVLVIHADEMETARQLIQPIGIPFRLVEGGKTRRDSALAGVRAAGSDFVLIHDGARPFPSPALIHRVLSAAQQENAVIPVLPITDLLHHVGAGRRIEELSGFQGHSLVRTQTPQGFRRDLILRCLETAPPEIRDDASALLLAGKSVATVPGERTNIKITYPEDVALAEAIAASSR
jgi:2-C-methyl-D-erythritol 4-phosphate cytidylyltransferase